MMDVFILWQMSDPSMGHAEHMIGIFSTLDKAKEEAKRRRAPYWEEKGRLIKESQPDTWYFAIERCKLDVALDVADGMMG